MHGRLVSIKCATKSLQYDGVAALEQGACTFVSRTRGGKLVTRAGKYLTVWRKDVDGKWRIAVNLA
jgi:ketosteroid isomerase-like protein